eukprot:CAMPEP_0196999632 /NCGR_PEP_ID=MMETSP1380-20130617/4766_1 /TAXON_ID=5936 /ORGANISM="Euplotes crassus, Strain CT5" /LENGTH=343 /DNA_ID=CAMNT_0042416617 /DNA_START=45 /DNA_END=1076 /DNA_ORIENTATION=-
MENECLKLQICDAIQRNSYYMHDFYDFDGSAFKIINEKDAPHKTMLCFTCRGAQTILDNGGQQLLEDKYAEFCLGDTHEGFEVVLTLDPATKPQKVKAPSGASDEEKAKIKEDNAQAKIKLAELADEVAGRWCRLKSEFMGAPIRKALVSLQEDSKDSYFVEVPYRKDEKYWVKKQETSALFYYNLNFTDPTDIALTRMMCNELKDTKKISTQSITVNYQSKVSLAGDLVAELGLDPEKSKCGLISFTLKKEHIKKNLETACYFLTTFRQYVEFHIRMVKLLLHSRMRKRISKFEIVFAKSLREGLHKKIETKTFMRDNRSRKPEEEKISTSSRMNEEEYTIG